MRVTETQVIDRGEISLESYPIHCLKRITTTLISYPNLYDRPIFTQWHPARASA